jgi:hypothetical protein
MLEDLPSRIFSEEEVEVLYYMVAIGQQSLLGCSLDHSVEFGAQEIPLGRYVTDLLLQ